MALKHNNEAVFDHKGQMFGIMFYPFFSTFVL
jgi:hypothetical protein